MRILVLDDSPTHRLAAAAMFKEHDLTVVDNYDRAIELLKQGSFDAFLGDLLLPASKKTLSPDVYHFVGEEMPFGSIVALVALKHGVKHVAVITDMNHHMHPAAALFDAFWPKSTNPFSVGDARILCSGEYQCVVDEQTGERISANVLKSEEGKKKYPELGWQKWQGLCWAKDWERALADLLSAPKTAS